MEKRNYYPNQRQVKINKTQVAKQSGLAYLCIYRYLWEDACVNLKPNTFKVWLWFASNKPNYTTEYSSAYISKILNISINTAKSAFKELEEKGYLVENQNRGHLYDFYEAPQKKSKINIKPSKKEFIDFETGEIYQFSYAELLENIGNEAEARQLWEECQNEVRSEE